VLVPSRIPLIEVTELDPAHSRRERRHSSLDSKTRRRKALTCGFEFTDAFDVTQTNCPLHQVVVICEKYSAFSCRSELARLKAKDADVAERSALASAPRGALGVRGVFDDLQVVFAGERE